MTKYLRQFRFAYKRAFRLSLILNALLIVMAVITFLQTPASAVTLRVVGSTDSSTTYRLDVDLEQIVYVRCVSAYGGEPSLGYLSNELALTCPS
ncbi:hypothetical protein S7335_711 [Synechococcus sp. PCC 7335]|uniref:hypothetical protein n=1 Tax=Synechococcus sp. (strain ATCC 29403 / PCC 7335) TaxID=91464 RepID=UPI00017EBCD1|nr:hypothetical protein [Synechococcus sp. PCC 7335]EDX83531.1 hypothetical protein S7335_711 [Synechococcus sp. PCC 7335]